MMRTGAKIGDDGPRQSVLGEGALYEAVLLADGRVQVTIDRTSWVIRHAGPLAGVRQRLTDAGADAATIEALLVVPVGGGGGRPR